MMLCALWDVWQAHCEEAWRLGQRETDRESGALVKERKYRFWRFMRECTKKVDRERAQCPGEVERLAGEHVVCH